VKPEQKLSDSDQRLAARREAAVNPTVLYNTYPQVWEKAAKYYRARPDGGPTFRVLEGNVWGVPKTGWVARFASSEEAERVILAAARVYRTMESFRSPRERAGGKG
jgi:hypothetical protein